MDFSLSPEIESLRQQVAAFVEAEIMPLEHDKANYDDHENFKESVVAGLREKAKAAGLWGFQLPYPMRVSIGSPPWASMGSPLGNSHGGFQSGTGVVWSYFPLASKAECPCGAQSVP